MRIMKENSFQVAVQQRVLQRIQSKAAFKAIPTLDQTEDPQGALMTEKKEDY
jgi:hypothetical protein